MFPERVWYVAYGSNVNEARFLRYLNGDDDHVGARDATAPQGDHWAVAPLQLRFAGESQRWNGGGVAFVDPDPQGAAHVRAWDVTREQFEDVFAQENRREVGSDFDWSVALTGGEIGTSWYRRVLPVDLPFATADRPALTFTWASPLPANPPHESYAETIATGLATNPALSPTEIATYLDR